MMENAQKLKNARPACRLLRRGAGADRAGVSRSSADTKGGRGMNIKQTAAQSGIAAANIRYYEQQGLLAPARLENGYRDYSAADLETLSKIKLLRELGLPVETIRRLQAGEESLPDVLAARMEELQAGAAAARAARSVCAAMRAEGADYATLNAEKYLTEAARLAAQAAAQARAEGTVPPPVAETPAGDPYRAPPARRPAPAGQVRGYTPLPLPDGWKQVAPMPWRRYFARMLDLDLCRLAVYLVLYGGLRVFPPADAPLAEWGLTLLAMLVMLLAEPLCLMWFGTTPGKWVMGIRLVWRGGRKFFYSDGLVRTARVLVQGFGGNLPLLSWFCLWRAWRNEKHGTYHPWEDPGEWYLVRENDRPGLRLPLCIAANAATAVLALLVSLNGCLPAHYTPGKGVTAEQFAANFNAYNAYFDTWCEKLRLDGSWVEPNYVTYHTVTTETGEEYTYKEELPVPLTIQTDAEGCVTRVSHTWQSQPYDTRVGAPALRMQLCLLAFAAAQPGASAWQLVVEDDFYQRQIGSGLESVQFTVNGVRATYTVTQQGFNDFDAFYETSASHSYRDPNGMYLTEFWHWGDEPDPDAFVRIEFTLEKLP